MVLVFIRGSPWYTPRRRLCRIHTQLFSVGQESLLIGQNIVEDEELCGDAVSGTHRSTTLSLPEREMEKERDRGETETRRGQGQVATECSTLQGQWATSDKWPSL